MSRACSRFWRSLRRIFDERFAGEHFVLTEVLGFALMRLAAVLAKFLITGGIDVRLFIAVALYFGAGRVQSQGASAILTSLKMSWLQSKVYLLIR